MPLEIVKSDFFHLPTYSVYLSKGDVFNCDQTSFWYDLSPESYEKWFPSLPPPQGGLRRTIVEAKFVSAGMDPEYGLYFYFWVSGSHYIYVYIDSVPRYTHGGYGISLQQFEGEVGRWYYE